MSLRRNLTYFYELISLFELAKDFYAIEKKS